MRISSPRKRTGEEQSRQSPRIRHSVDSPRHSPKPTMSSGLLPPPPPAVGTRPRGRPKKILKSPSGRAQSSSIVIALDDEHRRRTRSHSPKHRQPAILKSQSPLSISIARPFKQRAQQRRRASSAADLVEPPIQANSSNENNFPSGTGNDEDGYETGLSSEQLENLFDSDVSSPPPVWNEEADLDDDLRQMRVPIDDIVFAQIRRSIRETAKRQNAQLDLLPAGGERSSAVTDSNNGLAVTGELAKLTGSRSALPPRIGDPAAFKKSPKSALFTDRRSRRINGNTAADDNNNMYPDEIINNDFCDACNQPGEFVCCESCPRSFHFCCTEPPFDPESANNSEHWFCNICLKKNPLQRKPDEPSGIFGFLLDNLSRLNPVAYSLPDEIKFYFKGVACDPDTGAYIDNNEVKSSKNRSTFIFEGDLSRLVVDKETGMPLLCHKCSKSSLNGQIISCDFCPLIWHLDCVDPPLVSAPPVHKKWMCPAHSNTGKPRKRRVARTQQIVTVNDPDIPNNGDVEVELDRIIRPPRAPLYDQPLIDRSRRTLYKVPEHAIKYNFIRKVGTLQELAEEHRLMEEYENNQSDKTLAAGEEHDDAVETTLPTSKSHENDGRRRSVRIPRKIAHMYGTTADENGGIDMIAAATIAAVETVSPARSTRDSIKRPTMVEVEVGRKNGDETAAAAALASAQESNLWLLALSRFYDDIYDNLRPQQERFALDTENPLDSGKSSNIQGTSPLKSVSKQSSKRSAKRSAVEEDLQPQPQQSLSTGEQKPVNTAAESPFQSSNDLDFLYQVAIGELIPSQPPLFDSTAVAPSSSSSASVVDAIQTDYRRDPLFHQFLAWKRWSELERKRARVETLLSESSTTLTTTQKGSRGKSSGGRNDRNSASGVNNRRRRHGNR